MGNGAVFTLWWIWGEKRLMLRGKKGRRHVSHTKQMKVSECIIQETGQGMFENIFKRTAGSLPASVCVLNIGTASSVWRNWYWLNNLSRLRLNPSPPKLLTSQSKSFINCCLPLLWRSSVSWKKKVFLFGQRCAKGMWWHNLVAYWSWRKPTVSAQLEDRVKELLLKGKGKEAVVMLNWDEAGYYAVPGPVF